MGSIADISCIPSMRTSELSSMNAALRGRRRTLAAMLCMAGGGSYSFAQAPIYKVPVPSGLMVERWRHSGDPEKFFDPRGDDLRHELWCASREGKNGLLVFFRSSNNAYADLMKESVLRNEEVQGYFKARLRTIALDRGSHHTVINLRGETVSEARFAAETGVSRSPAFAFFDLQGKLRYLHQRAILDASQMINFARCMADGIYARAEVERSLRGG